MGDYIIAFLLLGGFVALMLFIGYKGYKNSAGAKRAKDNAKQRLSSSMNATLKHVDGLPLPQGVMVEVYYCPDKIVFVKDKQEISISKSKITGIDCTTGTNIKGQQAAGAAAGKYIFGGMTGAVIGSLAATTTYLIIAYNSNGENKCITLDTASSGMFGLKVQKDFKKNDTSEERSIEL